MIEMKPVIDVQTISCPCCGVVRLEVQQDGLKAVGSRYWLSDGDTISPLWTKLTDAQKEPNNFDYMMMVGDCPSCGELYYVAEVSFMAGERDLVEPYLQHNVKPISTAFFTCAFDVVRDGIPSKWLRQVSETPLGTMHTHTFGPFALESTEGVIGQFGVSSCGSSSSNDAWERSAHILSSLWDELRGPFTSTCEVVA
jgi:hypothetical protein